MDTVGCPDEYMPSLPWHILLAPQRHGHGRLPLPSRALVMDTVHCSGHLLLPLP